MGWALLRPFCSNLVLGRHGCGGGDGAGRRGRGGGAVPRREKRGEGLPDAKPEGLTRSGGPPTKDEGADR